MVEQGAVGTLCHLLASYATPSVSIPQYSSLFLFRFLDLLNLTGPPPSFTLFYLLARILTFP